MSAALENAVLETVVVNPPASTDNQGLPTYGASVNIQARVVREEAVVRMPSGEDVRTAVTIWVPGTQSLMPVMDAKLTCLDGLVGIVVERKDGKTLANDLDHVRVRIREV